MSLFFSKKNVSFFSGFFLLNKFPCHLFVFSNCSSFKAPCHCSFLPLYRLFLETGEPGGGMKFRGVNCSRSKKLFPLVCSFFPVLSSHDLCGLTPVALLIPGQAVADPLCAQRAAPSHAVLLCKLCLLLPPCSGCCFSAAFLGQPVGQKVGRWSSRVLGPVKHWRHLGGYVP